MKINWTLRDTRQKLCQQAGKDFDFVKNLLMFE